MLDDAAQIANVPKSLVQWVHGSRLAAEDDLLLHVPVSGLQELHGARDQVLVDDLAIARTSWRRLSGVNKSIILEILPSFGGLVLGRIEADF